MIVPETGVVNLSTIDSPGQSFRGYKGEILF